MNIQKIELLITVPTLLVVEPWAMEYQLEAGSSYILEFQSEQEGRPEVVEEVERLIVFGWNGATYTLSASGGVLDTVQNTLPDLPEGMTTSEMFKIVGFEFAGKT